MNLDGVFPFFAMPSNPSARQMKVAFAANDPADGRPDRKRSAFIQVVAPQRSAARKDIQIDDRTARART
jgi:hypothetical protein